MTVLDTLLNFYSRALGVSQQWNTFAPVPPHLVLHYSVLAKNEKGESQKVWSDSFPLDSHGAGWRYDPQVKFLSILGLPMLRFQEQVTRALSAWLKASELILQAEEYALYIGPDGKVKKSPQNVREILKFQP